MAVKLDPPFRTQTIGNAQRTVFDVISLPSNEAPVTPVDETTVEVQCANMETNYDVQYYVRNIALGTRVLGITYGSPNAAETQEPSILNAGSAVSFGAIDFDTPNRGYQSLRLTIDTLDPTEFEVFVCTRTSRDLSRVTGDVYIGFGRCENRFVVTYEGWPSGAGTIELDLSGGGAHAGGRAVSGASFVLDDGEKLTAVVASTAGTAGSGRHEFETVPFACRDRDGGPHVRRFVTERLMTTYTFAPGVCPEEDLLRFCSAGGGAWALPGATVVAGTRDGAADAPAAPFVSVGAADLDWRTVPVETIAECHALCVQVAEAAAGADTDTASVCALLHWKPPSLDTYGRCSMLVGAPYHPSVVGAPAGYTSASAVQFDASFLGRASSTDTDYLVLCPSQTDPADTSSDAPSEPEAADPVCPDGFRVRPGDNTDEAPVCVQLQCPSDMFANPSQKVRPFFPRGPHCGPKEERVSQRYPAVAPVGTPTTVEAFQAPAAPTLKFRALSLGPWTCTSCEPARRSALPTRMFRWTCPTCRPRARGPR